MIAWLVFTAVVADSVHGICEDPAGEEVSLLQLRRPTEEARTVEEYIDRSGHEFRKPTLYCYVFLRSPLPRVTEILGKQLNQSCDDWDLFSSESNRALRVTKIYEQSDFDHDWNRTMRGPVIAAWKNLLRKYDGNPFDWVIKLDYDSFVRPSTFRDLFRRYATEEPLILSADEGGSDGYFDAVNSKAAKLILPEVGLLGEKHVMNVSMDNCATPISGHNNDGGVSTPLIARDGDYWGHYCAESLGVKTHFPKDSNGEGLLVTHFGKNHRCCERPELSRKQLVEVANGGSRCFPTDTSTQCISAEYAVVHPVKDYEDYIWLASAVV